MALYKNEELQVIDVLQEKLNCHKSPTPENYFAT
jgi:hypothetical protein